MKATSLQDKRATTAHLIKTIADNLGHVARHEVQLKKSTTKAQRTHNHTHIEKHLKGASEHTQKLIDHLKVNYPGEAREMRALEDNIPRAR